MRSSFLVFLLVIGFTSSAAVAQSRGSQPLSKDDQKALQDTQEMMNDRKQIDEYTAKNPSAKAADEQVKALMGDQTDATYDLASQIFGDLVQKANGDPAVLMKLLDEAKRNPAAFAKKLTPAQQAQIKAMAEGLNKKSAPAPQH